MMNMKVRITFFNFIYLFIYLFYFYYLTIVWYRGGVVAKVSNSIYNDVNDVLL